MRPRGGYSEEEIDAYVLADQERRADARTAERLAHPERWRLVWDEWSDVFGPTWQEVKEGY